MRGEIELLACGRGRMEREAKVTCERVRAAEGKDADCRRGMMCESLNDLVQCAVAAAGEDELRAVADCIGSLRAGGSGAAGCDDLNLNAMADERARGMLEWGAARVATAPGVRIEDEGRTRHALSLLGVAAEDACLRRQPRMSGQAIRLVGLRWRGRCGRSRSGALVGRRNEDGGLG